MLCSPICFPHRRIRQCTSSLPFIALLPGNWMLQLHVSGVKKSKDEKPRLAQFQMYFRRQS
jgi:hypothetical protein